MEDKRGWSELSFYQDDEGKIIYADQCKDCERGCKQSFRAAILTCPEKNPKNKK